MRLLPLIALLSSAMGVSAVTHPDLSGTWRMDPARSESAHQDVPSGSATVKIQLTDAGVTIETTRDEGDKPAAFHETLNFTFGGAETTTVGNGNIPVQCKAHWDGAKLVIETVRNIQESTVTTLEIHTLSANGHELTIEKTLTVQHGYMGQHAPTMGHGKDVFVRAAQ